MHIHIYPRICAIINHNEWPGGGGQKGSKAHHHTHEMANWLPLKFNSTTPNQPQKIGEMKSLPSFLKFPNLYPTHFLTYVFIASAFVFPAIKRNGGKTFTKVINALNLTLIPGELSAFLAQKKKG